MTRRQPKVETISWEKLVCRRPANTGNIAEWSKRASCRDADPALFFQEAMGSTTYTAAQTKRRSYQEQVMIEEVRKICLGCPVRSQCLWYAIESHIEDGMWGGATRAQRASIRRHRRIA